MEFLQSLDMALIEHNSTLKLDCFEAHVVDEARQSNVIEH